MDSQLELEDHLTNSWKQINNSLSLSLSLVLELEMNEVAKLLKSRERERELDPQKPRLQERKCLTNKA